MSSVGWAEGVSGELRNHVHRGVGADGVSGELRDHVQRGMGAEGVSGELRNHVQRGVGTRLASLDSLEPSSSSLAQRRQR